MCGDPGGDPGAQGPTGQGVDPGGEFGGSGGNVAGGTGVGGATGRGGSHGFAADEFGGGHGDMGNASMGGDAASLAAAEDKSNFEPMSLDMEAAKQAFDNPFSSTDENSAFEPMSLDMEAAQADSMNAAIDTANQESTNLAKAISFLTSVGQLSLSFVIGNTLTQALTDFLKSTGMNSDSIAASIEGLNSGQDVASGISDADFGGPGEGGPADFPDNTGAGAAGVTGGGSTSEGGTVTNDPLSYDFWNSFVDEWMGKNSKSAKDMYAENDAFKKSQVEPAIGKYQSVLADLANQAKTGTGTYTPTTFGMGNFRSSFVPKSGLMVADDLKGYGKADLASSLALTDVMQPNKGSLDYLDQMRTLAQWKYEMAQAKELSEKGIDAQVKVGTYEPDDKGSWLDAIKDMVLIGDTVGDSANKWFGEE